MLKSNCLDRLAADKAEDALQGLAQKIFEEFQRRPASQLEVIRETEQDSHGAGASAELDQLAGQLCCDTQCGFRRGRYLRSMAGGCVTSPSWGGT